MLSTGQHTFTKEYVYLLARRGEIPMKKVGHFWLTTQAQIVEWLEQGTD